MLEIIAIVVGVLVTLTSVIGNTLIVTMLIRIELDEKRKRKKKKSKKETNALIRGIVSIRGPKR